eukprot:1061470-Pelagomonas_calceolata.AAC.1
MIRGELGKQSPRVKEHGQQISTSLLGKVRLHRYICKGSKAETLRPVTRPGQKMLNSQNSDWKGKITNH